MWKDESVGMPNRALMKLFLDSDDKVASQRSFLEGFRAMSEDFKTPVPVDQLPIMRVLKTQKRVEQRLGLKDAKTGKPLVFDISGEPVIDEEGSFIGGVVLLRDVTEYLNVIAAQKEQNVQQVYRNIVLFTWCAD